MKVHRIQEVLQITDDCLVWIVILVPFISLTILALLLLAVIVTLFLALRTLIVVLANVFKGGSLKGPVPLRSAVFRSGDPVYTTPTCSVLVYCVLEGKLEIGKFKSVVRERVFRRVDPNTGKRFYKEAIRNMSLWCGYPFWREPPGFTMDPTDEELDKFVSFYKNDPNLKTDWPMMKAFMDRHMYEPYSRAGPLVDIVVFPNYTPDTYTNNSVSPGGEYTASVVQFHHGLCDGYACMKMLQSMSILTPEKGMVIPRGENYTHGERIRTASWTTAMLETLKLGPKFVFEVATLIYWQFTNCMGWGIWEWEGVKGFNSSDVGLSSVETQERRVRCLRSNFGTTIPLSVISEVKNAYGGRVSGTSLLYAALVGAVRRTMYTKKWAIPSVLGVSVPLPLPGHEGKFRNHMTAMKVFLPLCEPDPVKRLFAIDKSLKATKTSTIPMFVAFFLLVGGTLPRLFYRIIPWIMGFERALTTSNLPGPKEPFDVAGYRVRDIGWSAGASVTLNVLFMNIISFGGLLRVSFMGPRGLLDHEEDLEKKIIHNFFLELEDIHAMGSHYCAEVGHEVQI